MNDVVKCLREQVESLDSERREAENLYTRAVIAENALKMREAEFKLKTDELEETIGALKEENEKLRNLVLASKGAGEQVEEHCEKYLKWKRKFKTMRQSDQNFENAAKVVELETCVSSLTERVKKLNSENECERRKSANLMQQLGQSDIEVKRLRSANAEGAVKLQRLAEENSALKEDNKKLNDENQKKATLLQHTRKKQEKAVVNQRQAEETAKQMVESQRRAAAEQRSEVARANERADKEAEEKRQLVKEMSKMKKRQKAQVSGLEAKITELENEKKALVQELDECKNAKQTLEESLEQAKLRNQELNGVSKEVKRIRRKNKELTDLSNEQQTTIQKLTSNVSEYAQDIETKQNDLRRIMSVNPSANWQEILEYIQRRNELYKTTCDENEKRQEEVAKLKKKVGSLQKQAESYKVQAQKLKSRMERRLEERQKELDSLKNMVGDKVTSFRSAIRHRMDAQFSTMTKGIVETVSILRREELQSCVRFRELALAILMMSRWRHYKHTQVFDSTMIMEFTSKTSRRQSTITELVETAKRTMARVQELEEQLKDAQSCNANSTAKIQKLENELKVAQETSSKHIQANSELTKDLEAAQKKVEQMISSDKYRALEQKLDKKVDQYKSMELQLSNLKREMTSLLQTNEGYCELQENMETLASENKTLKQELGSLRREHEVTETALKEKTREILALERRVMRQRPQATAPDLPTPATSSDNFCPTDSLKSGLAAMQTRMMQPARLI